MIRVWVLFFCGEAVVLLKINLEDRNITPYIYIMDTRKVLELLSQGNTAAEIGKETRYSQRSIEKEIEALKRVHAARNVTHLVAIAIGKKIIKPIT
jgi:DNA-binding NarL/FixJ family response regulator